jgi:hypothetical protein
MTIHPFDLQARAVCAAQALTQLLDPQRDGLMYFLASWRAKPPRADHGLWDCGDGSGRHIDALTLARSILPVDAPQAQPDIGEAQIERWMLRFLGQDGLSWLPQEPWAAPWGAELLLHGGYGSEPLAEVSWAQRGTLLGLTSRFQATGDERYLVAGRRLVDGLLRVAERHPDGLFYPEGYYRAGGWHYHQPRLCPGLVECNAAVLLPAVRFCAATGYAPARELAEGLARLALKHTDGYLPDGRLRGARGNGVQEHFHTRSNFILGILELGLLSGRREYIAWARQSYAYAQAWGTDFGWFPEGLGHRHGEICGTTDMLEIALQLGQHVDTTYFADAERLGRNQLLESQFLSHARLADAVARLPEEAGPAPHAGRYSISESVLASQVGAFAARSTLNDAFHLDATAMMQCCNAAGTRGLYDLWRYAVAETPATRDAPACSGVLHRLALHLRFSVQAGALRVVSHEPARGQLDITCQQDARLAVRLPHSTARANVLSDAATQVVEAQHGYVHLTLQAGQTVRVIYSLGERVVHYRVGDDEQALDCVGHWRGETLMRVEPAGAFYPFYQRPDDLMPVEPMQPRGPLVASLTSTEV